MKFKKGDVIKCNGVNKPMETGYAIFPGDVYEAEQDSYFDPEIGKEVVDLVMNGDGEPGTCYSVEYFDLHTRIYPMPSHYE